MNTWIRRVVTTLLIAAQFAIIPSVSVKASANDKKESVENKIEQTQKEIDQKLSEASEITISLEELEKEIEEQESSIAETETEIEEQELLVEERYEYTAEQLKVMQKGEVNQNIIIGLFQSESLSDFINRLYTVSVLTNASEELLNEAHMEYEELNEMKEELVLTNEELNKKEEKVNNQKVILDEKLAELKTNLAKNQEELDKIKTEEAAKNKASSTNVNITSSNQSSKKQSNTKSSEGTKDTSSTEDTSSTKDTSSIKDTGKEKGSWMNFQSTGYSTQQPGLSTRTATGINLLVNPRVIAVDPSQIPLGSLVEVEGMGVYVAGDTGSAINGQIIDVHFSTVSEALNWGRRNVRIRILN